MPELGFVALPLPSPLDMYNAAFEKVSNLSPSPSCAAPFGKLNPSNSGYLISQTVVLARFSLSLRFRLFILFSLALSSSLQSARNTMPALHHHFTLNRLATLSRAPLMLGISPHSGWLAYVSCLVLAAGLSVAGHSVTYPCPGTTLRSPVLRLDEAGIEDLNTLQATHLVRSVDLVHACSLSLCIYVSFKTKC